MSWVRTAAWIVSTAVAFVVLGALTLFAAAYVAAAVAPQSDQREFVVGGATLAWSLLGAGAVLASGRLFVRALKSPSGLGAATFGIGLVTATAVNFVVVADIRQSVGYYEPDTAGPAVLVAPALLALALAALASDVGPDESEVAWRGLAVSAAVGVFLLTVAAFLNRSLFSGVATSLVLLASAAYAVVVAAWSTVRLSNRRDPIPDS